MTQITLFELIVILSMAFGCKQTTSNSTSQVRAIRPGGAVADLSAYVIKSPEELDGILDELPGLNEGDPQFNEPSAAPCNAALKARSPGEKYYLEMTLSLLRMVGVIEDAPPYQLGQAINNTKIELSELLPLLMKPVPEAAKAILDREHVTYSASQISTESDPIRGVFASLRVVELFCANEYTRRAYQKLNEALRSTDDATARKYIHFSRCVASAINRLPPYKGPAVRGDKTLPADEMARYVPGAVVTEGQFLSASEGNEVSEEFRGDVETRIHVASAGKISLISDYSTEKEILFPPGTKYKVIDVKHVTLANDKSPSTIIELDQIP